MPFQSRPGARVLVALALVVGAVTSGSSQTPPTTPAPSIQTLPTTPRTETPAAAGPARSLSIDEAVRLALQQNLGIQIERLNPQLQDYTIAQALSNYTPVFGGGVNWRNQDSPPSSFLSGGETTITDEQFGFQTQFAKLFPWGTDATVSFDSSRAEDQQRVQHVQSDARRQPGRDDHAAAAPQLQVRRVRQQIAVGRKNREIADVDLQQAIASHDAYR